MTRFMTPQVPFWKEVETRPGTVDLAPQNRLTESMRMGGKAGVSADFTPL